jgi:hypothetical protein
LYLDAHCRHFGADCFSLDVDHGHLDAGCFYLGAHYRHPGADCFFLDADRGHPDIERFPPETGRPPPAEPGLNSRNLAATLLA